MWRNSKKKKNLSLVDNTHLRFMRKAINLALRAKGDTSPNPVVGALIVKNRKIVGTGFHRRAGLPHAEVVALDKAKDKAKGATLYVTLEPCSTYGRTPPCVNRILESGIKRVIIGMKDPNPINRGKGIRILKENKIDVKVGFLETELKRINESFIKYVTKKLPFITVKVGQSLDGRIATKKGESKWITSKKSRDYSQKLRRFYDAVMVGVNTVIKDNPLLNQKSSPFAKASGDSPSKLEERRRTKIKNQNFFKIIVDSKLRVPLDAQIFSKRSKGKIIVATTKNQKSTIKMQRLRAKGVEILEIKEKKSKVNLLDLMKKLAKLEITNILVEGGGRFIGSLFDEGLVDKVMFFLSPKIIGGDKAISSVEGEGISNLDKAIKLKDVKIKKLGEDILFEGYVK